MPLPTATRAPSFTDPEVLRCPFAAYRFLREEAPVYFDAQAQLYVISRYEDIKAALRDSTALNSEHAAEKLRGTVAAERHRRIREIFATRGWPRERPIGNYEGEEHDELRELFEQFLRAGRIKEYDAMIRDIAYSLVEQFARDGRCELVSQFSEQLSLRVICKLLGAPDEALRIVKESMDAMVANLGFMQTEAEELAGVEKEISAQHFFKRMIDNLRAAPNDTILSAFVNAPLPSGKVMTDAQILMHVMLDLFMAGAETTAKAITSGVAMLCRNPSVWQLLQTDPDARLRTFIEEVLRLEGPASCLNRVAQKDITLHGTTIPKGSMVMLRIAAANRDPAMFTGADEVDLERGNAAKHLSFGSGVHSCLGAPLARRELHWAFKALLDHIVDPKLEAGETAEYVSNLIFRGIARLNITFLPRGPA